MHISVNFALRSLLLRRIYPADVRLIRNDSKAAELVSSFVGQIAYQVDQGVDLPEMSLAAAKEAIFKVRPLIGLSPATLRKYIAELWREEHALAECVEIRPTHFHAYDERVR